MQKKRKPRIALVHDYLREYGGAERVVEALHELYPSAPLYTAFVDSKALGIHWKQFAGWDIRETWISRLPLYKRLFSPYRIFAPKAFASLDLSGFDVVISSSNAYFAKAITVPDRALHVCYCHTPARSLYGYSTMTDWKKNTVTRIVGTLINHVLRVVDVSVAQKVPYFIANSQETKRRIEKFYRRSADVIYPPVVVPDTPPAIVERSYYLYVGRLAASKHVDLAILACTKLGLPLKVVGSGKGTEYLKAIAGPTVSFVGSVDDVILRQLYARAKGLLFPAEDEDFGIVPIEAMGHGVPVLAHFSGGPKETCIEGKTGMFFTDLTVDSLVAALKKFDTQQFDPQVLYKHAQTFSKKRFQNEIAAFVASKLLLLDRN